MNKITNKNINVTSIVPIRSYLYLDKQKDKIYEDNNNMSGVYRLVNNINGKTHINCSTSLSREILLLYNLSFLKSKVKGSIIIYRTL